MDKKPFGNRRPGAGGKPGRSFGGRPQGGPRRSFGTRPDRGPVEGGRGPVGPRSPRPEGFHGTPDRARPQGKSEGFKRFSRPEGPRPAFSRPEGSGPRPSFGAGRTGSRGDRRPSRSGFPPRGVQRDNRKRGFGPRRPAARPPANTSTSWGKVATWYRDLLNESDDTYQKQVILPNLLRIVAPEKGMHIIDIGCGEGFFSRALGEKGATVFGVDVAPELIDLARTQGGSNVSFSVASADAIKPAKNASYDSAVAVLMLQNIKNMTGVVQEAARVLKKGGNFVIVLNHPAFRIPRASSWMWDTEKNMLTRRLDRYLNEQEIEIEMHPGSKEGTTTLSYHRSLQAYIKALTKHGFVVTGMEEWISHKTSEAGPKAEAENAARKEFPLFLMIKATVM